MAIAAGIIPASNPGIDHIGNVLTPAVIALALCAALLIVGVLEGSASVRGLREQPKSGQRAHSRRWQGLARGTLTALLAAGGVVMVLLVPSGDPLAGTAQLMTPGVVVVVFLLMTMFFHVWNRSSGVPALPQGR